MISTHFAVNSILMQNTHWNLILHGIDGKYLSFKVSPQSLVWEEKKNPRGTKQFHAWECELGKSAIQLFLVQKIQFRLTNVVNQNTRLVHYKKKMNMCCPSMTTFFLSQHESHLTSIDQHLCEFEDIPCSNHTCIYTWLSLKPFCSGRRHFAIKEGTDNKRARMVKRCVKDG